MRRLALACALLLGFTLGCRSKKVSDAGGAGDSSSTTVTPPPPPAPPAADTTPAVPAFTFDQRQQFVQSIRQQLTQIDQRIAQLASEAKSRGGAVSDRALVSIRTTRKTLDRDLRRVNTATATNWDQLKRGIDQGVERLNEAIEAAQPK
jgi:hypothetical protein